MFDKFSRDVRILKKYYCCKQQDIIQRMHFQRQDFRACILGGERRSPVVRTAHTPSIPSGVHTQRQQFLR